MNEDNSKHSCRPDDTNPFGTPMPDPRPKRHRLLPIGSLLALGTVLAAVWLWQRSGPVVPATPPAQPHSFSQPLNLVEAQLAVNEIAALEELAYRQKQQLAGRLEAYRNAGGTALVGFDVAAPVDVSERIRRQAAALDGDPARVKVLSELSPLLNEIGSLRIRIAGLESRLGAPRRVRVGETHSGIVREYLRDVRRLPEEEVAARLLQVGLLDPLLPGNNVWNLWLDEGFFSFVTQGSASLPPGAVLRQEQQRQRMAKEAALRKLNTLQYMVDTRNRLIEKGILSNRFLKSTQLEAIDPARFRLAIDLRQKQILRISARALGLPRIDRITVFPREFLDERDFSLTIADNKLSATIHLLAVARFRTRHLVIAVD